MYKSSWGWTLGCSKHVEDTISKLENWNMNVNSMQFVGSYYIEITQWTFQTTTNLVNQMHSLFKEEKNLLPWWWTQQAYPKTLFTNERELNNPRHCCESNHSSNLKKRMEITPKHEYLPHKQCDVISHKIPTSAATTLTTKNISHRSNRRAHRATLHDLNIITKVLILCEWVTITGP